jgi:hypothetical protein
MEKDLLRHMKAGFGYREDQGDLDASFASHCDQSADRLEVDMVGVRMKHDQPDIVLLGLMHDRGRRDVAERCIVDGQAQRAPCAGHLLAQHRLQHIGMAVANQQRDRSALASDHAGLFEGVDQPAQPGTPVRQAIEPCRDGLDLRRRDHRAIDGRRDQGCGAGGQGSHHYRPPDEATGSTDAKRRLDEMIEGDGGNCRQRQDEDIGACRSELEVGTRERFVGDEDNDGKVDQIDRVAVFPQYLHHGRQSGALDFRRQNRPK